MVEEIEKVYYLAYDGVKVEGFYINTIHKTIPKNTIIISEDLWKYLLTLNGVKLINELSNVKDLYGIEDKDLFCSNIPTEVYESPMQKIENENAELLLNSVQKEIEISNLQSDIANILLQLGGKVQ